MLLSGSYKLLGKAGVNVAFTSWVTVLNAGSGEKEGF